MIVSILLLWLFLFLSDCNISHSNRFSRDISIGEERVACLGSKLTNSQGQIKLTHSPEKKKQTKV